MSKCIYKATLFPEENFHEKSKSRKAGTLHLGSLSILEFFGGFLHQCTQSGGGGRHGGAKEDDE